MAIFEHFVKGLVNKAKWPEKPIVGVNLIGPKPFKKENYACGIYSIY